MSDVVKSRGLGDVLEAAVAKVFEQQVAAADRGDKKVRITVIVDIRERGSHADTVFDSHTSLLGDIFEGPIPQVLPEFASTQLRGKVNVVMPVAVDIRDCQAIAVIVMDGFVQLARVVHDLVFEANAASQVTIDELEIVENFKSIGILALISPTLCHPWRVEDFFRVRNPSRSIGRAGIALRFFENDLHVARQSSEILFRKAVVVAANAAQAINEDELLTVRDQRVRVVRAFGDGKPEIKPRQAQDLGSAAGQQRPVL